MGQRAGNLGGQVIKSYLQRTVFIPRCKECEKIHAKIRKNNLIANIIIGIVAPILWIGGMVFLGHFSDPTPICSFEAGLPVLVIIFFITRKLVTENHLYKLGVIPESRKKDNPNVVDLIKAGFAFYSN
jgi:uncharacterized protein (DUF983 family)